MHVIKFKTATEESCALISQFLLITIIQETNIRRAISSNYQMQFFTRYFAREASHFSSFFENEQFMHIFSLSLCATVSSENMHNIGASGADR